MRTGQWKTMGIGSLIGKMIYAVFGLAASMLCIMGYYPVVPAFYTACCLDKKRNFLLYIGLVVGMGWCMPVAAIVKYLFILFVLGIAIRFYMGKQALQRMDGRNDCGNYNDRDEYIGTSDSEYGEKGIDPWHQRRCDRVCTGSIVPLWNRNGQSDFPGET